MHIQNLIMPRETDFIVLEIFMGDIIVKESLVWYSLFIILVTL